MRGERQLLCLGEYLVGRACQRLPPDIREERHWEWAAELPAILHDPQIRAGPRRAVRMLGYAAGTFRGAVMTPARARRQTPGMTAALNLLLVAILAVVAWEIWAIVRAPGHPLNYLQLASGLLQVAFPISLLVRSAARVTVLIFISSTLAGVVVNLWNAAQALGDWVNYFSWQRCSSFFSWFGGSPADGPAPGGHPTESTVEVDFTGVTDVGQGVRG